MPTIDYDTPDQDESPTIRAHRKAVKQVFAANAEWMTARDIRTALSAVGINSPYLQDALNRLESSSVIIADRSNVLITKYRRVLEPVKKTSPHQTKAEYREYFSGLMNSNTRREKSVIDKV